MTGAAPERLEGPSFPAPLKWVASALVLAVVLQATRESAWQAAAEMPLGTKALVLAAIAVVLVSYRAILRSRTSIDATSIRQSWIWTKEVALADIAQLKLIRVRGFDWLVAPRLVVRARGHGIVTFHAADPAVLAAFETLAYGRR